jgi:hypothetical protein
MTTLCLEAADAPCALVGKGTAMVGSAVNEVTTACHSLMDTVVREILCRQHCPNAQ